MKPYRHCATDTRLPQSRIIMDLTVEAEAFGAEIVFPEDEVPSVSGRLLRDEAAH